MKIFRYLWPSVATAILAWLFLAGNSHTYLNRPNRGLAILVGLLALGGFAQAIIYVIMRPGASRAKVSLTMFGLFSACAVACTLTLQKTYNMSRVYFEEVNSVSTDWLWQTILRAAVAILIVFPAAFWLSLAAAPALRTGRQHASGAKL